MFYEERTGDGNVTFSDKLPPTLLNHAKMMAIESIPIKDFLFVNISLVTIPQYRIDIVDGRNLYWKMKLVIKHVHIYAHLHISFLRSIRTKHYQLYI